MRKQSSYDDPLKSALVLSAIVHLFLFFLILAVPGLPSFHKEESMDVTWVELPKGTSEEIGLGIKESKALPETTVEQQKAPPTEEQMPLPPIVKEQPKEVAKQEPKVAVQKKPTMALDADKAVKKPVGPVAEKNVGATENKKIKDALAAINKQLKDRSAAPEVGQLGQSGEGYKYGTGDKPLRVPPSDPEYMRYQAQVRSKVMREWVMPSRIAGDGERQTASIIVMISKGGDIISTRFGKKSGDPSFDQSALQAVRKSAPFPTAPARLAWEVYNEGFLINFDTRMKSR